MATQPPAPRPPGPDPAAPAGALSPAALASLADLLDGPLVLVDAGCRWGASEGWEALLGRIEVIGFDPDEEECARLNAAGVPGRRYVPFALGARTGTARLHLTAEPACSSLYPPDRSVVEERPLLALARPAGTGAIAVTRLDEWLRREGIGRVDALKLDVQGSELAALEGTGFALEGVRAVETEVTFNRIYDGQPLFADIDRFLRARGFLLWRLRDLVHYGLADASSAYSSPERNFFDSRPAAIAAEGGQLFWANAFYVPRGTAFGDEPRPWRELVRDALVASAMSFPDLARRALGRAIAVAEPEVRASIRSALAGRPAPRRGSAGPGSVGILPPRPGG
jgi:FkbM family methyltransferase